MSGNVRRRLAGSAAIGVVGVLLASCSVNVPDPEAPKPSPSESTLSTPTITPGHDAEAVAAKDLPMTAGGTLAPGDPVTVSSRMEEVPGWSLVHSGLQGEVRYKRADGCTLAIRVSVNQGPLVVSGDDDASTRALFHYLDAGIAAETLKPVSLRWGQDNDKPQHSVEFLALDSSSGGAAAMVLARLFSAPASSVYISLACPNSGALASARAEMDSKLAVVPPS
ncbi:hypothetical protein IRJ34_13615 [Paenarthrobacter sp. GOM3]|uniref:hypothetical protein n=1 Tax=Paenarthrobacter sp. GOM3 TaxID=2782567 RepID=UPI001BA53AFE|nr:hypothetical protein [Paenarthrobacter sp. GOM3]WOH17385.1 hypothetical protein IRJ34_13615 [Paenarthrobacter sp. GOM3]